MEDKINGTKGDMYAREIIKEIMEEGCLDKNPRPKYPDGIPAHTYSINQGICKYNIAKGESPLWTIRPIATKSSIGELLWIYQNESNELDLLKEYGVTWWDEWDIGNRTIGACYGETVKRHKLMSDLLEGLKKDPDGRRHILSLWQVEDFNDIHGLKPCAFLTMWNVRHGRDGVDYLDMTLVQRSSDYITAGSINQFQYMTLLELVARHTGYKAGNFCWFYQNIQIYDRHMEFAEELLNRDGIPCNPHLVLNPEIRDFYDFKPNDIILEGYPTQKIKTLNPNKKLDLGI